MTLKRAFLVMLLQVWWWEFFREKYVTSQEIIDLANDEATIGVPEGMHASVKYFYRPTCWVALRVVLDKLEIRSACGLDSILDQLKNDVIDNFVVERDGSCARPVKWSVKQVREYRSMTDEERAAFLAARKEAGLKIDPATAEVDWSYEQTLDPYGIDPDLAKELYQVGRQYFARAPGSDIWVCFHDLPDETREALWSKRPALVAPQPGDENA